MILDRTTERLRSKHVRTLELLQQTLDENAELRDRLSKLHPAALPFAPTSPRATAANPPLSNRAVALEEEMERLKAEHCRQLLEAQDAARARLEELTQRTDALQSQAASLETALRCARDTLRHERFDRHSEAEALRCEVHELRRQAEVSSLQADHRRQEESRQARQELEEARSAQGRQQQRLAELDSRLKDREAQLDATRREVDECRARASTMDEELTKARGAEQALASELSALRSRESELQQTVAGLVQQRLSSAAAKSLQTQHASLLGKLQEVETRNTLLVNENRSLRDQLAGLQSQIDRSKAPSPPLTTGSSVFAVHVDLKRENQQLRAQVDELKQLQRKFLTTAKKKTIAFPAL